MLTKEGRAEPSIVRASLRVVGNLDCDGDIEVDGIVEGNVRGNVVAVGASGVVNGAIHADVLRLAGTVNGEITARVVETFHTARILGDVSHEILSIEMGTYFQGRCKPLSAAEVRPRARLETPRPSFQVTGGGRSRDKADPEKAVL